MIKELVDDRFGIVEYFSGLPLLGATEPNCACSDRTCDVCEDQKILQCVDNEEWDKICDNYSSQYFSCPGNRFLEEKGVIQFPPVYSDCVNTASIDIALKLKTCFERGVLVTNYNYESHLEFLYGKYQSINERLQIYSTGDYLKRVLLFDVDKRVIVNVRITESEDVESIEQELIHCRDEMKVFSFMNQRCLKDSGISLTFVVVAPNLTEESLGDVYYNNLLIMCRSCRPYILTGSHLDSPAVKQWWSDMLKSDVWRFKRQLKLRNSDYECRSSQATIISHIFGFMAGINSNIQSYLPSLSEHMTDRLSSLMLNPDQMKALNFGLKNRIIKGSLWKWQNIDRPITV